MDSGEITLRRLRNLGLAPRTFESAEEVVGRLGAVQSQDYGPAKWSVARRAPDTDDTALDRAFDDGIFLRTHVLRPTWHFVLPADIAWLLKLTGPRVQMTNAHRYRQLGLDAADLKRSTRVITRALRKDQLTRKEIAAVLESAGIDVDGQRLPHMLMNAELEGVICSGALNGKQHTYALLEDRAPHARTLSPDEALSELTLRYFSSHGPATVKDFGWWSSLTVAQIKQGLDTLGSAVESEIVDGIRYWFVPATRPRRSSTARAELLQAYDEYCVGYSESKFLLDLSGMANALRDRPAFNAVVILDGQVIGRWKRTAKKDSVVIEAARAVRFPSAADRCDRHLGIRSDPHRRMRG